MVRNLVPLLEILACLYCIAGTYGKKVRCNIYVVVFVIAEMLLLIGINDHGIPTYLISLSYVLIFIYCLVDYNASVIQAIINLVISVVLLGIFQLVGYFVLITIFRKHDLTNNNWEVAIMAFSLVISYFLVPKMHLNSLSEFLRKNKFIAQVVLGICDYSICKSYVEDKSNFKFIRAGFYIYNLLCDISYFIGNRMAEIQAGC